ncbi:hypothetical protein GCM10010172_83180 [Paractinoplanes ferrugineus]|uniref:Uncharacterized protein n=2 Tax=Paractinoplanes ferrugineus TaxID=113564 RepID=A0A919MDJ1_9ACTN|nr:hypothetical protein Afe05nite_24790 [Actinoplanes ferrugineus]
MVLPLGDERAIDQIVRAGYLLGGWTWVERTRALLTARLRVARGAVAASARLGNTPAPVRAGAAGQAVADETEPALVAWRAARQRLARRVAADLARVEAVGRAVALRRLDESERQVRAAADRYLTGDFTTRGNARLKPGVPVESLRSAVTQLATAEAKAAMANVEEGAYAALASTVAGLLAGATGLLAVNVLKVAPAVQRAVARGVELAALRAELGAGHPVLYRIDLVPFMAPAHGLGTKPPTDGELLAAITAALTSTWKAARAVRKSVESPVWNDRLTDHVAGPAAGLAAELRDRGMRGNLPSLLDPAFGPWAFQQILADAVGDLCGPGPSSAGQAVHDVYRTIDPELADEFGSALGLMGGMLTLHLVAPPLAIVADVVLAAKGILEAWAAYLRDADAYRCALDPAESLGVEPSTLKLALQCVGEVAGALPAGKLAGSVTVLAPLAAGLVK